MKHLFVVCMAAVMLLTGTLAMENGKQDEQIISGALTITLEDCSGITILETDTQSVAFSGDSGKFTTDLNGDAVTVRQLDGNDVWDGAELLEIPAGRYSAVRLELNDSGVTVRPGKADYTIAARKAALSLQLGQRYNGTVSVDAEDSAFTVSFVGGEPESLRLAADTTDCAVSVPDDWGWNRNADGFRHTWGAGAGHLTVTARDCSMAFQVDMAAESRYSDKPALSTMIHAPSGELAFRSDGGYYKSSGGGDDPWSALRSASTPNTVTAIQTIPNQKISILQVNADLCGVAVEPCKSESFELSYIGVKDTGDIIVEAEVKDGVLTVTCTGATPTEGYVSTSPDFRVNTVLVGVPAGALDEIRLDCGVGSLLVNGLDVPVDGVGNSGLIRVTGNEITSAVELRSGSGALSVQGTTVSAPVTMNAKNGSVELAADIVTGQAELSAQNGSVDVQADRLDFARLESRNGMITADVGIVGKNVFAGVENGMLEFHLTQKPQNLTFRLSGGWDGRWGPGLPKGWRDGYTVGTGKPVLELSAASNGILAFTAG